jgi:hypothetical protein
MHHCSHLLLLHGVPPLGIIELATLEGDGMPILYEHSSNGIVRSIRMYLERLGKVRQGQHWFLDQGGLEILKGLLALDILLPCAPLLQHVSVQRSDVGIALDEPAIVVGKAQERAKLGYPCRWLPFSDGTHLRLVHPNSSLANNVAQEVHFLHGKAAFLPLDIELIVKKRLENLPQVLKVFGQPLAIHHDVI